MTWSQKIQRCFRVKDHFSPPSLSLACHEDEWRRGITAPRFLNLCPICNRVVPFMLCPFQPRVTMGFGEPCARWEKKKTGNVRINEVLRRVRVIIVVVERQYYIFWVCVCNLHLFTRHAMRMRRVILSSVTCTALQYFSMLSHKR